MDRLFFDVETTGLPINYKGHYSDVDNWPRIVQISWLVADSTGKILRESDNIIKVDFEIPAVVSRIHGITNATAEKHGKALEDVMARFRADVESAHLLVCHNVNFDLSVLHCELVRLNLPHPINKSTFCTMINATNYCRLPGNRGYKWPRLDELYQICFGSKFENAHNALADVKATHKVFHHLVSEGIFRLE